MTLFERICKECNIEITTDIIKGQPYYTKDAYKMNNIVCELIDDNPDCTDEELLKESVRCFKELYRK